MVLAAGAPFAVFITHLCWRRLTYGEWVPNTYFAKVGEPWPEAGWRYIAVFVMENGVWSWALLAFAATAVSARALRREVAKAPLLWLREHLGLFAVAGVAAVHVGYYAYKVGGDHFGLRSYTWLLPPLFATFAGITTRIVGPGRVGVLCVAAWLVSTHALGALYLWRATAVQAEARSAGTKPAAVEVAPMLPAPLSGLLRPYDRWNAWMDMRLTCLRRHRHTMFLEELSSRYPERTEGEAIAWDGGRPVLAESTVGIPGWVLPNVAIIDTLGLNDAVVARGPRVELAAALPREQVAAVFALQDRDGDGELSPDELGDLHWLVTNTRVLRDTPRDGPVVLEELQDVFDGLVLRFNAHGRKPPAGYVEAFRPNVVVDAGRAMVAPRAEPLTDAEIRAVESRYRER